jgi:uroporphyrinogen-III synthase
MTSNDNFVTLTRDERGNRAWRTSLEQQGIQVYELPCIETIPSPLTPTIQDALSRFTDFHWVVLTSAAGVRHFAQLVVDAGLSRRQLTNVRYAAVGAQTAEAIKSLGLVVRFTPSEANAANLARELKQVKSRQILLLHTNIAPPEAADILRRRSANVTVLPIYQTVPVTQPDLGFNQLLRDGSIGHLLFASPSAVDGIQRRLADPVTLELARGIPAIAFGPAIAAALEAAGFRDIRTASDPSLSAVIEQLA